MQFDISRQRFFLPEKYVVSTLELFCSKEFLDCLRKIHTAAFCQVSVKWHGNISSK